VLVLVKDRALRATLALALASSCLLAPARALAAPAVPTAPAAGTAQTSAQGQLERMRVALQAQVAEYVALGRDIDRTRAAISELTSQSADADAAYVQSRESLRARAVALYRGDQLGLIGVLFGAQSIDDFIARSHYLVVVSGRDASLLREVRLRRTENLWLQESLAQREAQLSKLQDDADEKRKQIETDIKTQQATALAAGQDMARLLRIRSATPVSGSKPSGDFNPDMVISETNFRNSASMTAADIQLFLESQPGQLADYRGPDWKGNPKSAAEMISEACTKWGISPKVVLATLQKEQSLLSRTSQSSESMDWAMGCGKADSFTSYQYQGFGKQIWYGTYKLKQNADLWKPGATLKIDGSRVQPANPGTFGQYRYTPHFPGVMSFWLIYWRYFGDPLA
jgi:hypothetical protein